MHLNDALRYQLYKCHKHFIYIYNTFQKYISLKGEMGKNTAQCVRACTSWFAMDETKYIIKYNWWQQRNGPIIHDVTSAKYKEEFFFSHIS